MALDVAKLKVLVVEDDSTTRRLLEMAVHERGHVVIACETAEEAQAEFLIHEFPLVILDLNLPGMDGLSFCRWLRARPGGDRHFILIGTSRDRPEDLEATLLAGANDFLVKPYELKLLRIRLAIAESQVYVMAERHRALSLLRGQQEQLELRVRERTAELAQANASLRREVERRAAAEDEKLNLIADLQAALANVKTVSGLLPICSWCHRIRDDSGYWNQLEVYLREHSEADFSHSVCPECASRIKGGHATGSG